MVRKLFVAAFALALIPAGLAADEIKCKVKSVNAAKNSIVVMVGEQERTYTCDPKCQVTTMVTRGRLPRRSYTQEVTTTLASLTQGQPVTMTTKQTSGQEMVMRIRTEGGGNTMQQASLIQRLRFRR